MSGRPNGERRGTERRSRVDAGAAATLRCRTLTISRRSMQSPAGRPAWQSQRRDYSPVRAWRQAIIHRRRGTYRPAHDLHAGSSVRRYGRQSPYASERTVQLRSAWNDDERYRRRPRLRSRGWILHTPGSLVHTGLACPDDDLVFLAVKDTRHGIVGPPVDGKYGRTELFSGLRQPCARAARLDCLRIEESRRLPPGPGKR